MLISLILVLLTALFPADTLTVGGADAAPSATGVPAFARPLSESEILFIEAEDQRLSCEFSAALDSYRRALSFPTDSVRRAAADSLMTLCRNGAAMSRFCHRPKVAGRQRFAASEFLDWYPLDPARRSRLEASPVDTLMLVDSTRFAAFFPIESEGYIYFSSRNLFGMGGSDLYRCRRLGSTGFVSEPENLGFPYSSPADDFLLLNTSDGEYSIFASNRDCSPDSVWVYALVREAVPVRSAVAEGAALRELCSLAPKASAPVSAEGRKALSAWKAAQGNYRSVQDSLARHDRELDALRRRFSTVSGAEKQFLGGEISHLEMALPALRRKASAASERLSAAEADCRRYGIDPEASDRSYTFKKQ